DPEVAVRLPFWWSVSDFDPDDAGVALDRHDVARHLELLVVPEALRLPHLADRVETAMRALVGGGRAGGVLAEELRQCIGAKRPPGSLVAGDPVRELCMVQGAASLMVWIGSPRWLSREGSISLEPIPCHTTWA